MPFKTIYITNDSSQAEVIKLQLTEVGITTFLKDSVTAQVTGVPLEVGGIKIQVEESNLQDGIEKLVELGYIKPEYKIQQPNKTTVSYSQAKFLNNALKVALLLILIGFLFVYLTK